MNYPTLIIAGISLILSILTIYLTFLKPAKLKVYAGPYVIISRHSTYCAFSIATTIANQSNQAGVIKRSTLILTHKDAPQQNYQMLWTNFRRLNADGSSWIQGDIVSSVAVIAKSTINRHIEYQWMFESRPEMHFKEGIYIIQLYYWSNKKKTIAHLKHEIFINALQASHLNNPELGGKIIILSMDNDLNMNEVLTSNQAKNIR